MVVKHSVVATFPDEVGAEINKTEWNADHLIDDATFTIAKTITLQSTLDAKEVTSAKNANSGYAGLSATAKLTGSQQTYGVIANTACEGNDSRLSDARAPSSHTHVSSAVTDFDTSVRTSRLDQMAAPTASLNFNSQRGINVADPVSAQDVVSKAYVDAFSNGLAVKAAVRVATTANIILSGHQVIDGITTNEGDRVLVKNQTSGAANGIYTAKAIAWTRTTDADVSSEVTGGMFAWVILGTANGSAGFALTTGDPIVLGTTVLDFTPFSGLGQITAGAGLTKLLNTIDVNPDNVGIEIVADAIAIKNNGVVTAKIIDKAVTLAKIQDIATTRMLGRSTAGSGIVEELTPAQILTLSGAESGANKNIANGYAGLDANVRTSVRLSPPAQAVGAGTSPLKFIAGAVMTTPESGSIEHDSNGMTYATPNVTVGRHSIPVDSFYHFAAAYTTPAGGGSIAEGKSVRIQAGVIYKFETFLSASVGGTVISDIKTQLTLANGATADKIIYEANRFLTAAIPVNSRNGATAAAAKLLFTVAAIPDPATPISWTGTFTCLTSGTISLDLVSHASLTTTPNAGTLIIAAGGFVRITAIGTSGLQTGVWA